MFHLRCCCNYVMRAENARDTLVKWFFEDNLEPVYQWIPELNNRHTSGVLKNRLDLDFAVNPVDAYSRFRALRIQKPSTELSGKYTCLVSSLAGQDTREQVMTVFVPANEFELSYTELNDASVNVTCEAQGLFPPPVLKLYLGSSAGSPPLLVTDAISHFKPKYSGAYDAYLYRTFSASELAKNGASSVFECSLELPGTNYAKVQKPSKEQIKLVNAGMVPVRMHENDVYEHAWQALKDA
ncbi:ig-like domain-containing protein [Nephila pilipes]|uniref:Ig-like domain-containing protein n=1 Tax=Nephila pilipes TaxID=299642 RepID=A0A8X6QUR0_NEPPI|nr:ig-like domain-containing protein [Nephila pilipes]